MKNKAKIILVDLDNELSSAVRTFFENQGNEVVVGLAAYAPTGQDTIVIGQVSLAKPATAMMRTIKEKSISLPVILLVAPNSGESITSALVAGADFACEQFARLEDLKVLGDRAIARAHQNNEIISLREQLEKSSAASFGALLSDYPTLEEVEKRYLKIVLEKTRGRKEKASRILGINRRTLYRKEREYGWVTDEEEAGLEAKTATATQFA